MKRSHRALLASQTLEIIRQGWYVSHEGNRVSISAAMKEAVQGTILHEVSLLATATMGTKERDATLKVVCESTFDAMRHLSLGRRGKIGCLNFASAKNPGGGFLNGAQAQEEALARASGLYECLISVPSYYEQNRSNSSCLYLDLVIASPDVPFFRTDEGELIDKPLLATVITAPAPNAGAVLANEPERTSEIQPTLYRRAQLVLQAAVLSGVSNLVLGAWGCGVFRNDPNMVANAFARLLKTGGLYSRSFDEVVFAIFDPQQTGDNLAAFRRVFE